MSGDKVSLLILFYLFSYRLSQKAVGLLLRQDAEVNARDKFWQTPLHVAAANRATRCAEALIPKLSSLNVADRSGRTALHHAAHSGHVEVGSQRGFPVIGWRVLSNTEMAPNPL